MATEADIAIPFGDHVLVLTRAEFASALARGAQLALSTRRDDHAVEALVDSEQLAKLTQLPTSWLEEAARQGRIPSITAGRYRRFRPSAVIAALTPKEQTSEQSRQSNTRRR